MYLFFQMLLTLLFFIQVLMVKIYMLYIFFQCLMQNAGQQYCQGGATSHQNQTANFGHTESSNTVSTYLVPIGDNIDQKVSNFIVMFLG